tara:strand:- start:747 stop:2222 length:1476 start_codon:yes stop_codon:yes gene_type:complete
MSIKRYYATKDNTITNAFKANLTTRGVSGNMGQSDILETFSIYAQANTSSAELSRILIRFDTSDIGTDRTNGAIPASGSVNFILRLYNAEHSQTTPKNFSLIASAVSQSWQEGNGLDMENYSDEDTSNWISASDGIAWTSEGGDYLTDASSSFTGTFDTGFEDMGIDVTPLVEQWIDSGGNVLGSKSNYGFGIHLSSTLETGTTSYYTKKFFARGSQYFFKRPTLEARWDSSKKDHRDNFYLSSSLVTATNNLMNLYLYNVVRGQLADIPEVSTGMLLVSIHSGSTTPTGSKLGLSIGGGTVTSGDLNTTASHVETGIYSCSFAYTSSAITTIFDVWHTSSGGSATTEYHTGSIISVKTFDSEDFNLNQDYVSKITNLKTYYSTEETARFRLYTRKKDWSPTIYTVASTAIEASIVDNAYYKLTRAKDGLVVVSYGTGSVNHTRLSYDTSGSYFDFDMSMLELNNAYEVNFAYYINGNYVEQPETFRFNVA